MCCLRFCEREEVKHIHLKHFFPRSIQYLGGMTTTDSPFLGLQISTWASLALGLTKALGGMRSFVAKISGCSWAKWSMRQALCPRGFSGSTSIMSCILQRMVLSSNISAEASFMATSQVVKCWSLWMELKHGGTLVVPVGMLHVTLGQKLSFMLTVRVVLLLVGPTIVYISVVQPYHG